MAIFKTYDIRGIYPDQLDEKTYEKIGNKLLILDRPHTIVVGCDMRDSSKPLKEALIKGARRAGIDVIDIGLASTPMVYHASGIFDVDLAVMITASHNPKEYNGIKICKKNSVPVSYDSGLKFIEEDMDGPIIDSPSGLGSYREDSQFLERYVEDIDRYAPNTKFKVVFDPANGMGGYIDKDILEKHCNLVSIYTELDGSFPNHEANPIKEETLDDLKAKVLEVGADVGIAFDGDADRVGLIDENGEFIPVDYLLSLFVKYYSETNTTTPLNFCADLRISRILKETVESFEGKLFPSAVGHSLVKKVMRENRCFFGGEVSGHVYFWFNDDLMYDSPLRFTLELLKIMEHYNKPISELVAEFRKYIMSPEINYEVQNKDEVIQKFREYFSDGDQGSLDGLTVSYDSWWFNVRKSNTEDVIRIKLEANTQVEYDEKLALIKDLVEN